MNSVVDQIERDEVSHLVLALHHVGMHYSLLGQEHVLHRILRKHRVHLKPLQILCKDFDDLGNILFGHLSKSLNVCPRQSILLYLLLQRTVGRNRGVLKLKVRIKNHFEEFLEVKSAAVEPDFGEGDEDDFAGGEEVLPHAIQVGSSDEFRRDQGGQPLCSEPPLNAEVAEVPHVQHCPAQRNLHRG